MKKLSLVLLLAAGLVVTAPVNAMTEAQLRAKLTQSYTVNGKTKKLKDSQITQIDRYLSENEISAEDCQTISDQLDAAIALVEKGNATGWNQLTSAEVTELMNIVNVVTEKTAVKVNLDKNGVLAVYNTDGTLFTKLPLPNGDIQNTDASTSIVLAAGASISLVGLLLVIKKVVKANA